VNCWSPRRGLLAVEYLLTNPRSYEVGFFDAPIVDDEQIRLIEGTDGESVLQS
jgi:hypothetical protein